MPMPYRQQTLSCRHERSNDNSINWTLGEKWIEYLPLKVGPFVPEK